MSVDLCEKGSRFEAPADDVVRPSVEAAKTSSCPAIVTVRGLIRPNQSRRTSSRINVVFDTARRPWILPIAASSDAIATVITKCPSGALHYTRRDGGVPETPSEQATIVPIPDGPLYIRGCVQLRSVTRESPDRETTCIRVRSRRTSQLELREAHA